MSNHLLLDLGICATFHLIYRRTECKNRTKSCLVLPKISLIFLNIFGQLAFPFEKGRDRFRSWSNRETGAMHCERSVNIVTRWITIAIVIGRVNSVIQEWRELKLKSETADKTIKFFLVESVVSKISMCLIWNFMAIMHGIDSRFYLALYSINVPKRNRYMLHQQQTSWLVLTKVCIKYICWSQLKVYTYHRDLKVSLLSENSNDNGWIRALLSGQKKSIYESVGTRNKS